VKPAAEPVPSRSIRVFVSSSFRDMVEERNELMTHTWPSLRRFCRERQVEFVEVDLRWGIPEEHSTRKETLKLCLDEIRACRPYFIGLLGERYGWVPGPDALTADLREEQPWLSMYGHKSVTELEILHGVLNSPEMASRALFYLRDPAYAQARGADYLPEDTEAATRQALLKSTIRTACASRGIPLRDHYSDPAQLAKLVLEDLQEAIDAGYPKEALPDPLTQEARDHEAFAEVRRRTYIGRPDYFDALDRHAMENDGPLVLLGGSGSGKSTLLANWIERWRVNYPEDYLIQHYIGSTPDSADHWRLMRRLISEIKRWTGDPEEVPHTHDELLKTFSVWLAKARSKAEHDGVRCILVLDALNQLEDQDRAKLLGWLPVHSLAGPLRVITATLPGETLHVVEQRGWTSLKVEPLTTDERRRMIAAYLARFSKKLDQPRIDRLAAAPAVANPLYLKILLDELRVSGSHERLDERLNIYLAAPDIPSLLKIVLARYQRDYERDRPGLVGEALGLIWAARRGLSESELLELLRPPDQPQLPTATWAPLRAALEDMLVDRGGFLNFAHDFLRTAVQTAFVADEDRQDEYRLRLAGYFEMQPISARNCDELPWLLWETESFSRLRASLLDIDRFLHIHQRDREELMRYWVGLGEERKMGKAYLVSFESWAGEPGRKNELIAVTVNQVASFFHDAALHAEAEPLMRRALAIDERSLGRAHPDVAICLNNLAALLKATNRLAEAEPLMRRALAIDEQSYGPEHPRVAICLNNLAALLKATNRLAEAEPLMRRALAIDEQSYGLDHPNVATKLNNLAQLLHDTNRLAEAEPLMRRALAIDEQSYGPAHPNVAIRLNTLASLLQATNRLAEAEPLMRRALAIDEQSYGPAHPAMARDLNNLAQLLQATNRLAEAEPLMRRALAINERSLGSDHPEVATQLNNLATLLHHTNRLAEAEPLMRRALAIDEQSYGPEHPRVAICLNNLATLLHDTNRLAEAEPLMRRVVTIFLMSSRDTGHAHPHLQPVVNNYAQLLVAMNRSPSEILAQLNDLGQPYGMSFGKQE
jgi:nephrocystin-3